MHERIIREIEMEYSAQRTQNRQEEARRASEAAARDGKIGELIAWRITLFQRSARQALENPACAQEISDALMLSIQNIQRELRERLAAVHLPEDYLQPVYHCAACQDTGYVGETVRERCQCFARRIRERSGAGEGLDARETFEAYDETVYSDSPMAGGSDSQRSFMARVRRRCVDYADRFPENEKPNMLIFGTSGLGKTYLLNCIGNRLRQTGVEVVKVTAYQLTERMRSAIFDHTPEAFSTLLEVELLLLDDLGVEPLINNITVEQLFTLLNERTLAKRPTIISTNLQLDELRQRYTERVLSRMLDRRSTAIIQFHGKDVRLG